MKIRLTVLIFALATLTWAQTATPSTSNQPAPSTTAPAAATKAGGPCCKKMADDKTMASCCAHAHDGSAKSDMPCCKGEDGKDAMSCMKGDKDKSDAGCCANGKCGGEGKEGCCAKSDKTTEQAAMACCGAGGEHCGMAHHDHADINK